MTAPTSGIRLAYAVAAPARGARPGLRHRRGLHRRPSVALVLGDNIFYGAGLGRSLGAQRRGHRRPGLRLPGGRPHGVRRRGVRRRRQGRSPSRRSRPGRRAGTPCPGLYFYDNDVVEIAAGLQPERPRRARDHRGQRRVPAPRRAAGRRCSTGAPPGSTPAPSSRSCRPAAFVQAVEERQGIKIGCIEEVAFREGFIDAEQLRATGRAAAQERLRRLPARRARRERRAADVQVRELAVPDAFEFAPTPARRRPRASSSSGSRADRFEEAVGPPAAAGAGQLLGVSAAVSLRGIHFADVPPGQAKYVTCVRGAVPRRRRRHPRRLADVRPLGRRPARRQDRNAVYVAEGLGHAFLALSDDATLIYLCSERLRPAARARCRTRWTRTWRSTGPARRRPVLSPRDAAAPSLREMRGGRSAPVLGGVPAPLRATAAESSASAGGDQAEGRPKPAPTAERLERGRLGGPVRPAVDVGEPLLEHRLQSAVVDALTDDVVLDHVRRVALVERRRGPDAAGCGRR